MEGHHIASLCHATSDVENTADIVDNTCGAMEEVKDSEMADIHVNTVNSDNINLAQPNVDLNNMNKDKIKTKEVNTPTEQTNTSTKEAEHSVSGSVNQLRLMFENLNSPSKSHKSKDLNPEEAPVLKVKDIAIKFNADNDEVKLEKAQPSAIPKRDISVYYSARSEEEDAIDVLDSVLEERGESDSLEVSNSAFSVSENISLWSNQGLNPNPFNLAFSHDNPTDNGAMEAAADQIEESDKAYEAAGAASASEAAGPLGAECPLTSTSSLLFSQTFDPQHDPTQELGQDLEVTLRNQLLFEGGGEQPEDEKIYIDFPEALCDEEEITFRNSFLNDSGLRPPSPPDNVPSGTVTTQFLFGWGGFSPQSYAECAEIDLTNDVIGAEANNITNPGDVEGSNSSSESTDSEESTQSDCSELGQTRQSTTHVTVFSASSALDVDSSGVHDIGTISNSASESHSPALPSDFNTQTSVHNDNQLHQTAPDNILTQSNKNYNSLNNDGVQTHNVNNETNSKITSESDNAPTEVLDNDNDNVLQSNSDSDKQVPIEEVETSHVINENSSCDDNANTTADETIIQPLVTTLVNAAGDHNTTANRHTGDRVVEPKMVTSESSESEKIIIDDTLTMPSDNSGLNADQISSGNTADLDGNVCDNDPNNITINETLIIAQVHVGLNAEPVLFDNKLDGETVPNNESNASDPKNLTVNETLIVPQVNVGLNAEPPSGSNNDEEDSNRVGLINTEEIEASGSLNLTVNETLITPKVNTPLNAEPPKTSGEKTDQEHSQITLESNDDGNSRQKDNTDETCEDKVKDESELDKTDGQSEVLEAVVAPQQVTAESEVRSPAESATSRLERIQKECAKRKEIVQSRLGMFVFLVKCSFQIFSIQC